MKIGFTGTREGMTPQQKRALIDQLLLIDRCPVVEAHHGKCKGADNEFHFMVRKNFPKWIIVGHPPLVTAMEADCKCDEERPRKDYLERDKDIVIESQMLFATPFSDHAVPYSGTWATIHMGQRMHRLVMMIRPDGILVRM